ncbi:MAG: serine hydrolase domain-containing protein, partial [Calditrichota bacterium]
PGTAFNYSNSNYVLLTEIVGRITKQDFKLFADTLFQSLNMSATSYNNDIGVVLPNKARPYGNWGSWIEYPYVTEVIGDGALFSSLEDLLKWEILLQSGKSKVLSAELINKSQQRIPGSANSDYGYGLEFGNYRGMEYRFHDGSTGAFRASMLRFPKENTAIVVLTNSGKVNTNRMAKACVDLVLDFSKYKEEVYLARPKWEGKKAKPDELAGTYQSEEGAYIQIKPDDSDLIWRLYPYNPIRLIPVEGNVYHFEGNKKVEVVFNKGNDANFTVYNPGTQPRVHPKKLDFKPNTDLLASLNGQYLNDETGTELSISYLTGDSLSVQFSGREQVGKLVYENTIIAGSYSFQIDRKKGMPAELLLGDSRLKNVLFRPIQK